MRLLEVLTVGLICGVVVLLIINIVVLMENQELHRSYDELYQTYLSTIAPTIISPPVSKPEAIHIALEYGGWNETTLKGMEATATLCYIRFHNSTREYSYEVLYQVTEPISDYSPVRIGDVTYRYMWAVVVERVGPIKSIPPPGLYYVDAATSEVIPYPLL